MKHLLTLTITIVTILTYIVQSDFVALPFSMYLPITYHPDAPLHHYLLFHFFHVNIFHLLSNLFALWYYRPRFSTIIVSYAVATIGAYIDVLLLPTTTCGLSAFIFAAFARYFVAWHKSILPIILFILITAIIPSINWHVHLISFLLSYLVWLIIYRLKKK